MVIDNMNETKQCVHDFREYECTHCGQHEKFTCNYCGHETDLVESEGEIWHWKECNQLLPDDEYDNQD